MLTNQKSAVDKIESVIGILRKNLHESWLYFCIADELYLQYISKDSQNSMRFFHGTFDACIGMSILTLAELLDDNKDSVNLHYLLNLARDYRKFFQHVPKQGLLGSIKKYMAWLESLKNNGFSDNLFVKRDKILAHTDRKFVIEIESNFIKDNPPLDLADVRNVYQKIYQIVSDFEKYYYGASSVVGFEDILPEVKKDISKISERLP
jgi:hypothetical protein